MQSLDVLSDGLFLWVCLMVLASDWEQWQSPRESLLGLLWALVFGYRLGPHILYGPRVHIHVCHPGCSSWGSRSMSHPTLSPQKVEVKACVGKLPGHGAPTRSQSPWSIRPRSSTAAQGPSGSLRVPAVHNARGRSHYV